MTERVFQLLHTSIGLRTNCERVDRRFGDLVIGAAQSARIRDRWVFEVLREGGRLTCREDGLPRFCSRDEDWLVYAVHRRINLRTLHCFAGHLLLHAGYASWRGRSFLVAGDMGNGKTTLLCKLLLAGASVHCDDRVALEGSLVRPIPRKFHLKLTSLDQLPELRPVAADCGRYEGPRGTIIPIDPTVLGREWVADPGGVDAVFLLERNFAGNTHLSALPGSSVATALTHHITNYHSGNRKEMRALLKLAASVSGYRVRVGDLGQAVEQIRGVLDERVPARVIRPSATPDAVSVDRDRHLG